LSVSDDGFDVRSLAVTFRAGAELAAHSHAWGQLLYAHHGVMEVATPARAWIIPATRSIWIPAGVPHQVRFRRETAMRTLYIAPERAQVLPAEPASLEIQPLLRALILHILSLGMLAPARPEQDRLAGVLIDLLSQARRQDLWLPLPDDARARRLADRLREAPEDGRDLRLIAEDCGASLRTLQRLYPRQTGLTLEGWRRKARLIHAAADLAAGVSVTDAALDSGYRSLSAFITAFQEQFGVTPGRYGG
jgi:AraC-like DNA-binding protein/quercetin dioxygenase-like cupin family protein